MRTVKLYRTKKQSAEGKQFFDADNALAVDFDAYDQTLGFNLTTNTSFSMNGKDFEDGMLEEIEFTSLAFVEKRVFVDNHLAVA